MGISARVRVAPGVSVRASGQGVRTSVGPRAARVHVGGGRSSLSSGFGPFTASTSAARRPSRRSTGGTGTTEAVLSALSLLVMLSAAVEKSGERRAKQQFAETQQAEQALLHLHREHFPIADRRVIKPARTRWQGLWKVTDQARLEAAQLQEQADREWSLLNAHDPHTVIQAVDDAFADNASASACIDAGTEDGTRYVTLVVTYPGPSIANGYIRDQQSKQLRPRTQEEKATFYKAAIASTVIATAKEAFAVAPAATQARVVVLRNDKRILRSAKLGAIYAATFERSAVMDRDWKSAEPGDLVYGAADVRIDDPGNGATLRTLSAKQHPDLGDIARQIGSALDESDAEQN